MFLNGWLHVTASEVVRCLTDLAKCKICFIDSVVEGHQLTYTDCLNGSGTVELMAITVILIIWPSGYLFLMDWL